MKTTGFCFLLLLLLFGSGCTPVPQTAEERIPAVSDMAGALEMNPPETVNSVGLVVCSQNTFKFVYNGGDLITEVASFTHDAGVRLEINNLVITNSEGKIIVQIKNGQLEGSIPQIASGTTLVVQGTTCPN